MENIRFFKRYLFVIALLTSSLLITSCDKENDDVDDDTYALSGNASGAQESPSNSTSGTATLTGTYNANTNMLQYSISWSGLTGTVVGAHLHGPAPMGVNAGILVHLNISVNGINGTLSGSVNIADSVEEAMLNGNVYYNIHTTLYPAGEIRGQVVATSN